MSISLTALLLTLGCGLCWSAFDAFRKVLAGAIKPIPLTAVLAMAQTPVFVAWLLISGRFELGWGYLAPGVWLFAFNLFACFFFFKSLACSPLSLTIPILSLTPAFTALFGWLLLEETLSNAAIWGMVLVVVGTFFLNAKKHELLNPLKLVQALGRESGSLMMVAVAAAWAATSVLDKMAMRFAALEMHVSLQVSVMALTLGLFLWARGRLGELSLVKAHPISFVGGVIVASAALGLQLTAIQIMEVGLMEGIKRACGVALSVLLGRIFFQEGITTGKVVASLVMCAGIFLLAT